MIISRQVRRRGEYASTRARFLGRGNHKYAGKSASDPEGRFVTLNDALRKRPKWWLAAGAQSDHPMSGHRNPRLVMQNSFPLMC